MSPEWQYSMNTVIGRNSLLVGDSLIPSTEVFFVSPHRDRDFFASNTTCLRSVAVAGWRPMPRTRRDASGKNEESGAADAHQQPQVSTPSNPALCMLCLATPVRGDTPPFIHHQRPPPAPHASTTCPRIARMPATVNRPSTSRPSPYFKTIRRAFEAYQARASGGRPARSSTRVSRPLMRRCAASILNQRTSPRANN